MDVDVDVDEANTWFENNSIVIEESLVWGVPGNPGVNPESKLAQSDVIQNLYLSFSIVPYNRTILTVLVQPQRC